MRQLPPELPPRYRAWPDPERALLGRGGAGEVWRAQDKVLGVLVALKVWRAEGAKIKARLEREAALAARVTHPNVVGLHDLGTTPDGRPFLAFALASDGSFLERVRALPPWDELKDLFQNQAILFTHLSARYRADEAKAIVDARLPPSLRERSTLLVAGRP